MTDAIFVNGTLLTQDVTNPRAEALAVEWGRISAIEGCRLHSQWVPLAASPSLLTHRDDHPPVYRAGILARARITGVPA